jgi:hypothetical protein
MGNRWGWTDDSYNSSCFHLEEGLPLFPRQKDFNLPSQFPPFMWTSNDITDKFGRSNWVNMAQHLLGPCLSEPAWLQDISFGSLLPCESLAGLSLLLQRGAVLLERKERCQIRYHISKSSLAINLRKYSLIQAARRNKDFYLSDFCVLSLSYFRTCKRRWMN